MSRRRSNSAVVVSSMLTFAALLVVAPAPSTLCPVAFCNTAHAAEEDESPVAAARRLRDEAKRHFKAAGDTEASSKERRQARKEAFTRLKRALKLLDAYLAEHPDQSEALDDLYVEIRTMYFWVRKEAAIGEFGPRRSKSDDSGTTKTSGDPDRTAAASPTAAEVFAAIQAYEREHPRDVPGLHERYAAFLEQFPDRTAPEYAQAFERVEALDQRLKNIFRTLRDENPDELDAGDERRTEKLVRELADELENPEQAVRVRAATFLGSLGSDTAASPLVIALKKSEHGGPTFEACADALAKIGGKRVNKRLLREKADSIHGVAVLEVLRRTVRRGGVNARLAGEALGTYVQAFNPATQKQVAAELYDAGRAGAVGLALVVDLAPTAKKVPYIEHLGKLKEPRAAEHLAAFLTVNPGGARKKMHRAARKAIQAIGKPGVRYLIRALEHEELRVWTGEMLRDLTGARPKDDKPRTWQKWFRKNRRELEATE